MSCSLPQLGQGTGHSAACRPQGTMGSFAAAAEGHEESSAGQCGASAGAHRVVGCSCRRTPSTDRLADRQTPESNSVSATHLETGHRHNYYARLQSPCCLPASKLCRTGTVQRRSRHACPTLPFHAVYLRLERWTVQQGRSGKVLPAGTSRV